MKKRYIVLGSVAAVVVIGASAIAYGVLRKPKSSSELAIKSFFAMRNVKSFDIDGTMDAEVSLGSYLAMPATITFDGNYNIPEDDGLLNYTATTTILGKDIDYSDQIKLSFADLEDSSEATTETTSTDMDMQDALDLADDTEFTYDKEAQTYTITLNMEDVLESESIKEMLFGEDSTLTQIGITEDQFYSAIDDNTKMELTFDKKYYLSEISINSVGTVTDTAAKASLATDIHLSNYQ